MSEDAIEWESTLDLYSDPHRRVILAVLAEEQRSLTLNDLTKTILKHTRDTSLAEVSDNALTRIRTSLHHIHLPKLADAGLIDYDPERRLVEPTEQFDEVQPQLATVIETDPALETPVGL